MTPSNPLLPKPQNSIDLSKPLFDSMGNRHVAAQITHAQVLTSSRGFLFVWDKRTGECLIKGLGALRLLNDLTPKRRADERVTPQDRLLMPQAANVIDCLRCSSRESTRAAAARAAALAAAQGVHGERK